MDCISLLHNDLLLQILSLLPTKDVLTTSVLSKRWRNLWKLLPKLEYIDCDYNADQGRFLRFVDMSLLLNTAPVLESLHFKFGRECCEMDTGFWVKLAAERGVRELHFDYGHSVDHAPTRLPQSLFTCGTLVVLKLQNVSLVDVHFPVCFQLLKTLHLDCVIFLNDESPPKLLSGCPILQVLVLNRTYDDNVTSFSLTVPSLQRFIYDAQIVSKLVMNTPSLNYFKTVDYGYECKIGYLPEIVEAHIEVSCYNTDDILRSLASLKRLLFCLPAEPRFPTGSIFHQLEHLEFCTCETEWELLMTMLEHSPKLRSLILNEIHDNVCGECPLDHWEEPSSVPETLMLALETLEWRNYRGWIIEKNLARFILKHSRRLKIATFSPQVSTFNTLTMKYRMVTELARLPRSSMECELVFG